MSKTALITGITGQDGAYLAEFLLLQMRYEVHGKRRRASLFNTERVDHIYQNPHRPGGHFTLHYGDLTDASNLIVVNLINAAHDNDVQQLLFLGSSCIYPKFVPLVGVVQHLPAGLKDTSAWFLDHRADFRGC